MKLGGRASLLLFPWLGALACSALADENALPPIQNGAGGENERAGGPSANAGDRQAVAAGDAARGGAEERGPGGSSGAGSIGAGVGGEAGAGGQQTANCDPRILRLSDFSDVSMALNVSSLDSLDRWVKGAYDSTDTSTGKADASADPIHNPMNLANRSKLRIDFGNGDPRPSLRYSIPFSPGSSFPEYVNLLNVFTQNGERFNAVDGTGTVIDASVLLLQALDEDCSISASAWVTSSDGTESSFNHTDGARVPLKTDQWQTVELDLATSVDPTNINQFGFTFRSSCMSSGSGGASSGYYETIVLIDNIRARCE